MKNRKEYLVIIKEWDNSLPGSLRRKGFLPDKGIVVQVSGKKQLKRLLAGVRKKRVNMEIIPL